MTLGTKIKKLRNQKGLTQKDLADHVHVTFQTVSKWENDENEPDINTLRELAKLFDCSLDYLLSEEEVETKEELKNEEPAAPQSIIIHQKELHVCEYCKKDIPEDELEMENVCVRHGGRGSHSVYRQAYYHRNCLAQYRKEREQREREAKTIRARRSKKLSFGWSIFAGAVASIISLVIFFVNEQCKEALHPALSVFLALLIGYAIFAMVYCILTGSYIGDVFTWAAGLSIKFPGLIFSWDLEGFAWLIAMKILFAVLGFLIGVFAFIFAVVLSASLGAISFPFVLIHNIHTEYDDSLI